MSKQISQARHGDSPHHDLLARAMRGVATQTLPHRSAKLLADSDPRPGHLSIDRLILCIVRAAGGRIALIDLQFELRWRGIGPERSNPVMKDLAERAFLRGPLSKSLAYELTASGWDVCAALSASAADAVTKHRTRV